ncbi:hypothetical protein [Ferruginibacter sp. SUN106]|uniref:hypothetical protein n=1 Tax=Ferruginibacter sp. SUN106 TaxID=2978348 RepID=UPI003D360C3C
MKLKLTLFFSLIILCTSVFAQKTKKSADGKKPQLIGVNFILVDYNSPSTIKNPGTTKGYSSFRSMSKGLSLTYWKGLTSTIDFSTKINAIFNNYKLASSGQSDKTEIGLELEPTINIRPFSDKAKLAPFLTTGVGGGYYTGDFGAYIPAGVGLQLNCNSTTYLFVQAQYRFTLTKKVAGDNLLYSFGLAQTF